MSSAVESLACPLCRGPVAVTSSGCRVCNLTLQDVLTNQSLRGSDSGTRRLLRQLRLRLTGLLLYAATVAWCAFQLPDTLPFVVPGAVLGGGLLHVWKGRPWLGLLVFVVVVAVVPALLWPAMATGLFSDLTAPF